MRNRPTQYNRILSLLLASGVASAATNSSASASPWITQPHIQVRLLSSYSAITKDEEFLLGWELKPEEGWHVYWQNPGDSGMPPGIVFTSEHLSTGDIQWPFPHRIPYGPLLNYGYEQVILPVPAVLETAADDEILVRASANWLVCKEFCIPGNATMELSIPVAAKATPSPYADAIAAYAAKVPKPLVLMGGQAEQRGDTIALTLYAQAAIFNGASDIEFFPVNEQLVEAASQPQMRWKNNVLQIEHQRSSDFTELPAVISGVIVIDQQRAWQFQLNNP